ncbi:hypothetical protein [Cellulophaga sp. BC115SP]|uniref:hypothetical protein n=1 Tax=Cellulophaga sp. BC115SP TaxID=2683263 RepID=UPI001411E807|nr:hypothetical protein [Cellulophaga sp. BC115SP]NBB27445.1 hypothetical protein [Cellulophaga sp. BC115SP]
MIDFISTEAPSGCALVWLDCAELIDNGFRLLVGRGTGEVINEPSKAEFNGLTFRLIPSSLDTSKYRCLLSGSIHKYRNSGGNNHDRFTLSEVFRVLNELSVKFGIDLNSTVLHGVEFGVNLRLPYPPSKLIKSVVVHRNTPYEAINKKRRIGVVCVRAKYEIKIYDKGYVSGLSKENILRIEYKVFKMQQLEGMGISRLSDLCDPNKVAPLLGLLLGVLDNTVFVPTDTDLSVLTEREKTNFYAMSNAFVWQNFSKAKLYNSKSSLDRILKKCNAFDYQNDLKIRVLEEWEKLMDVSQKAEKSVTFLPSFQDKEALGNVTFVPLEYSVQKSQKQFLETCSPFMPNVFKEVSGSRCCITCGKDISMNKTNSVFCSEKYNPFAKRCRNKDSNKRRTFKRKIMNAVNKNKWLQITYKNPDTSEIYTDILHGSEVAVNRGYLNTIIKIEVLHDNPTLYNEPNNPHPEVITGESAKKLLEQLTKENQND